jgi:hypothetical protein
MANRNFNVVPHPVEGRYPARCTLGRRSMIRVVARLSLRRTEYSNQIIQL